MIDIIKKCEGRQRRSATAHKGRPVGGWRVPQEEGMAAGREDRTGARAAGGMGRHIGSGAGGSTDGHQGGREKREETEQSASANSCSRDSRQGLQL